jgi:hypothetical protein
MPWWWQVWAQAVFCAEVQKSAGQAAAGFAGPTRQATVNRMAEPNRIIFRVIEVPSFLAIRDLVV